MSEPQNERVDWSGAELVTTGARDVIEPRSEPVEFEARRDVDVSPQSGADPSNATASRPLVSVILCVFNGGPHLLNAVLSVLGQSYAHLELLVIDDGSTDGWVDALADIDDPRLRVLRQPNAGKQVAMNRALGEIRGEFYAIQDADDISHPERVARQLACLLANPNVGGVFCGYDLIIGRRRIAPRFAAKSVEQCRRDIDAFVMPGHDPTAMYRVAAVHDVRYDERYPIGEGLDYILRVGEQHDLMVCGAALYSYRVELRGLTRKDPWRRLRCVQAVLTEACNRRGVALEDGPSALQLPRRLRGRDRDNNLAAHFIESVVDLCRGGYRWTALRTGLQCARLRPFTPHYWKPLVLALLPQRAWEGLRSATRAEERVASATREARARTDVAMVSASTPAADRELEPKR